DPAEIFGKTMHLPDEAMGEWFELLAIERPGEATPRDQKRALARAIITRFHDADAAAAAEQRFDRVHVQHELPDEIEDAEVPLEGAAVHVPAAREVAFGVSRSEARRLLAQGGVRVDGELLDPDELDVERALLDGAVVQLGRRRFKRLHLL